jgi:hypothetical protein
LSVEMSLVVEMAKVGIIKPSSSTPHARLGTKRPVVNATIVNVCAWQNGRATLWVNLLVWWNLLTGSHAR